MQLLAIVGKKRTGKDTCADIISENRSIKRYALAYPIKYAILDAYGKLELFRHSGVSLTFEDINGETDYDRESALLLSNSNVLDLMYKSVEYLKNTRNLKQFNPDHHTYSLNVTIEDLVMKNTSAWSIRRLMQLLGTDIVCNLIDRQFWNRCMMDEFLSTRVHAPGLDYFLVIDVRQSHEIDVMRDLGATVIHLERNINNSIKDDHITECGLNRNENETVIVNNGSIEDLKLKLLEVV